MTAKFDFKYKLTKLCERCFKDINYASHRGDQYLRRRFCSLDCKATAFTGVKRDPAIGAKVTATKLARRYHHTDEWKRAHSARMKGKFRAETSWRWKSNRSEIELNRSRRWSAEYRDWRTAVYLRDDYKCRMMTPDCGVKLEAHHILSWKDYPELRYQINNGITLCLAHHPRKRAEEKRLAPVFQELVAVSKD
jgi:hypothetical protein